MKALVKQKRERGLWLEDVEKPAIGHDDVLIKVRRSAICGTDLHIYNWDDWAQRTIPVPMTVGHEYVGTIVEVGRDVTDLKVGERVSGEGHITCGHCRNCRAGRQHLCRNTVGVGVNRPGAFAEYIAIPARNAYPIPANLPDDVASILDPLGNAAHTALSYDLIGEDVLVTGAGPIGLMAAAIARHVGARHIVVTDVNPYRLALAEKVGATRAVDVRSTKLDEVMHELGMTEGFDVGLEMSGNMAALKQMIEAMYHGGGIALLGIPPGETAIDLGQVIFKGLRIKGIYGREMFETWYKMIAMLQTGLDLSPILTHRFPVEDYEKGFAAMNAGESGKVVLSWE
jgi:threonine 3-dehydrogenase